MAGVNGTAINDAEVPSARGGGVFSALARAQYAALAGLRWRIFVNGLRSKLGAFEMGARVVSYVLYSIMGLGLGMGAATITYALVSSQNWQYIPIVFWAVFLIWQVVPIMLASFQEQFDLGTLLRFPVSFSSFYLLYIVFGLSDVSTIIGGLCCLGVWGGITLARPDLCALTAVVLVVFAVFNIILVRTIFSWIDRWLSQRRTREILAALFMVFFLSFQVLNPAVWGRGHRREAREQWQAQQINKLLSEPWVKTANQVQEWLPPGLAAVSLRQAAEQHATPESESLAVLGVFVLACGGALGLRLRAEYRGENLGGVPAVKKAAASSGNTSSGRERAIERESDWNYEASAPTAAAPIAAIIQKEIRSLFRTLPLLYAIGAPLALVLVVSGGFIRGASHPHTPIFAFPLCLFFAQMGLYQLFANSLGAEGPGIQLYFLSPTPMRTVLLAKNLFHSIVFVLALVIAAFLATLRLGPPSGMVMAITVSWLLFVLSCNLALGNVFSLTMPYRVNPGRISRQRRSQASALLSLLLQAAVLGFGALVFAACSLGSMPWLAVPVFLGLSAIAVFAWLRILHNSDDLAAQRKDHLIATLMKAD